MAEKKRLDTAVFELGIAETRSKASALIMSGEIYVNGQKETKSGYAVKEKDIIEFKGLDVIDYGGIVEIWEGMQNVYNNTIFKNKRIRNTNRNKKL